MEEEGRRRARVWNYYNKQDEFWPMREWPKWVQELGLLPHKNLRERFTFFRFLAVNGLRPEMCGAWTLTNDVKQGQNLVQNGYDDAAWRHVAQMQQQLMDGHTVPAGLWFKGEKGTCFSMITGKVEYFGEPK